MDEEDCNDTQRKRRKRDRHKDKEGKGKKRRASRNVPEPEDEVTAVVSTSYQSSKPLSLKIKLGQGASARRSVREDTPELDNIDDLEEDEEPLVIDQEQWQGDSEDEGALVIDDDMEVTQPNQLSDNESDEGEWLKALEDGEVDKRGYLPKKKGQGNLTARQATTVHQPNLPSNNTFQTQLSREEHLSVEHEIFVHYFSQIVSSISAETLSPFFVQHRIISTPEHAEIRAALPNKAAGLLLGKISTALKAGVTEVFYKFLDITEQHGNVDSLMVISTIRKELSLLEYKLKDEGKDGDASEINSTDPAC